MALKHLRLLLWKNYLLKRRRLGSFLVEVFLPVTLIAILALVRTRIQPETSPPEVPAPLALPSAGVYAMVQSVLCDGLQDLSPDYPRYSSYPSPATMAYGAFRLGSSEQAFVDTTKDVLVGLTAPQHVPASCPAYGQALDISTQDAVRNAISCIFDLMIQPDVFSRAEYVMGPVFSNQSTAESVHTIAHRFNKTSLVGKPLTEAALTTIEYAIAAARDILVLPSIQFLIRSWYDPELELSPLDVLQLTICPLKTQDEWERFNDDVLSTGRFNPAAISLQYFASIFGGKKIHFAPNTQETQQVVKAANRTWDELSTLSKFVDVAIDTSNRIQRNITNRFSESGQPGLIIERWYNVKGKRLSYLQALPTFPDHPDDRYLLTSSRFTGPLNIADDYGEVIRGVFVAPATGLYTFWVASDDQGTLFLSNSTNPDFKVPICHVRDFTDPYYWYKYDGQQSEPIQLNEGERYYMELQGKEERGVDTFAVAVRVPPNCNASVPICTCKDPPVPFDSESAMPVAGVFELPDPLFGNTTRSQLLFDPGFAADFSADGHVFVGHDTEEEAVAAAVDGTGLITNLAAVVFDSLPSVADKPGTTTKWFDFSASTQLKYTIRMPNQLVPTTNALHYYFREGFNARSWYHYYYFGFVQLQDIFDRALVDISQGRQSHATGTQQPVFVQKFPEPQSADDLFVTGLGPMMPLIMTISWIYMVAMLVKSIVHEKEQRLKEFLRISGVPLWAHWGSWFITAMTSAFFPCVFMMLLLSFAGVLPSADPGVVFLLVLLFVAASICLSFLISVFFSRAKLAAACGGIFYFALYIPFVVLQTQMSTLSYLDKVFSSLSCTTAFGLACFYAVHQEQNGGGVQWSTINKGLDLSDDFSFATALIMLATDAVLYFVLAVYLDQVLPGQYGVAKHPLFFVDDWFGAISRLLVGQGSRSGGYELVDGHDPDDLEQQEVAGEGIVISGLSKIYRTSCGRSQSAAVEDLNLTVEPNKVTSLLGSNGSGKTTTISMLVGMFPPTRGTANIAGFNVRKQLTAARRVTGVCPQHNVLFDWLTPSEHVHLYAGIRGLESVSEGEVTEILSAVGAELYHDTLASDLSGGTKRKLSVALAFVGDVSVIILDEPTAGVDPSARRIIWDLVLSKRPNRTILLTTHHMDEADLLSDRVAVISHGHLCFDGTTAEMKGAGAGYLLTCSFETDGDGAAEQSQARDSSDGQAERLLRAVRQQVQQAALVKTTPFEATISLPVSEKANFPAALQAVEEHWQELGVSNMGIVAPRLEDAFVSLVTSQQHQSIANDEGQALQPDYNDSPPDVREQDVDTGKLLLRRQLAALFRKRLLSAKRDVRAVLSQLVLPVVFLALSMAVSQQLQGADQYPPLSVSANLGNAGCSPHERWALVVDNDGRKTARELLANVADLASDLSIVVPPGACPSPDCASSSRADYFNTSGYMLDNWHEISLKAAGALVVGRQLEQIRSSFYLNVSTDVKSQTTHEGPYSAQFVRVMSNRHEKHTLPGFVNLASNLLLQSGLAENTISPSGTLPTIETINHPLPDSSEDAVTQAATEGSAIDAAIAIFIIFALSFVPASVLVFLVAERSSKAKHLQLASGCSTLTYWTATFCWDLLCYSVTTLLCVIVLVCFGLPAYTGRNLGAMTMLILTYGWATIPVMYPASFLFINPSAAYVSLIVVNLFIGMTCTITTYTLDLFSYDAELSAVNSVLKIVFLIFPNYCLGRGIFDVARHEVVYEYDSIVATVVAQDGPSFGSALDWYLAGRSVCFMIIEGFVYFGLILAVEYRSTIRKWLLKLWHFRRQQSSQQLRQLMAETEGLELEENVSDLDLLLDSSDGESMDDEALLSPRVQHARMALEGVSADGYTRHLASDDSAARNPVDEDVSSEARLVSRLRRRLDSARTAGATPSCSTDDPRLLVSRLKRVFKMPARKGGTRTAVQSISFRVGRGECFGLLGTNGAGKTTTFRMLTSELTPTSGDAYILGHSVTNEPLEAHQHLGYCPQFDALLGLLTPNEHLRLFGCLQGIRDPPLSEIVEKLIFYLDLARFADRPVNALSAGNRRKLSLGLAVLGGKPLIFLDEPSAGMDPYARRFFWRRIESLVAAGKSVLLTSHSMDECEQLCSRISIMVAGTLRCMGSPQHLRSKYGHGYTLIINYAMEQSEAATVAITSAFRDAVLEEEHDGYARFQIPNSNIPKLSAAFQSLNTLTERGTLQSFDISQTTLEDVFCQFAVQASEDTDAEL